MKESENHTHERSYFAAANGYSGFRSYFDSVFNPYKLTRIFILKGGPGTGKSTLLKRLLTHGAAEEYRCEAIYCSSDPRSLDGVILSENGKSVAVIDGTAPHERDAMLPGAADEIVNLAEGFDIAALTERREEIAAIAGEKKAAYSSAYSILRAAGAVREAVLHKYSDYANYNEAELTARKMTSDVQESDHREPRVLLTSAFGAHGYRKIKDGCERGRRVIRICGDGVSEHVLMQKLIGILSERHALLELHLSPLSHTVTEAAVTDTHVFCLSDFPADVDTSRADALSDHTLSELSAMHSQMLELAKGEFARASERHFELESIYSAAVDFAHNDAITEMLMKRIDSILAT